MFLLCFCVQRFKFLCLCRQSFSLLGCQSSSLCRSFPALAEYSAPGDFRVDVWFKLVGFFWRLVMFAVWFCIVLFCKLKNSLHGYDRDFQFCCLLSYQRCTLLLSSRHVTNTGRGKKKTNREDAISQKHLKNFTATSSPLYWECFVSWHSNNHHELFTLKAHSRQNEISDRAHHPL